MLTAMIAVAMAVAGQSEPDSGRWTWTLYEGGGGPVVLANEIPDTPALRATIECEPRSGVARVTVYGAAGARDGFVDLVSGQARATAQGEAGAEGGLARLAAPLRLDHPVFTALRESGALSLEQGEHRWPVTLRRRHLPTLDRFAGLCGG